jgi:hypothetical protein
VFLLSHNFLDELRAADFINCPKNLKRKKGWWSSLMNKKGLKQAAFSAGVFNGNRKPCD